MTKEGRKVDITDRLMKLIAAEICGKAPVGADCDFTDEELSELYGLAKKHDLAHLVGDALIKSGLAVNTEIGAKFRKRVMLAVYRYEQLNYELNRLYDVLEEAKIPFVPLKGSVIRDLYPEPWMRTSCDIDLLVHDADKTAELLADKLSYKYEDKNSHDISMFAESGMHIELHYDLIEESLNEAASNLLAGVWDRSTAHDGCEYRLDMSDGMFYFYHIAHMAKHLENGGCGIRPFIDIRVLNHRTVFDRDKREELLAQGGLLNFSRQAELLSEVWLGNAVHTDITKKIENYVIRGGMYGTNENRIVVQQQKRGGKIGYALSRIFLRYDEIKFHYPILEKYRWLTPIMEVRRWCKLIFCGHLKRVTHELGYSNSVSKNEAEAAREFLKDIGL